MEVIMKKKRSYLSVIAMICMGLFSMQCAQRDVAKVVGQQTLDQQVEFQEYETYTWASQINDSQNNVYFLNDLILKGKIMHAVAHELEARGYRHTEQGADLVVNFRVFEEPVEITAVPADMGTGYWGPGDFTGGTTGAMGTTTGTGTGIGTTAPGAAGTAQQTYQLQEGSIIVQLADKESGQVVWQGFASGLTDGNVFSKDEQRITEAVRLIFDTYPHEATGLSDRLRR
jgi:hypothetical protein